MEHKRTRMAAWLLAIMLLGVMGMLIGADVVRVEASSIDPGRDINSDKRVQGCPGS